MPYIIISSYITGLILTSAHCYIQENEKQFFKKMPWATVIFTLLWPFLWLIAILEATKAKQDI